MTCTPLLEQAPGEAAGSASRSAASVSAYLATGWDDTNAWATPTLWLTWSGVDGPRILGMSAASAAAFASSRG